MPRPTALDIANAALAEIAGGQIDQGIELGDPQDDLSALVGSIYARGEAGDAVGIPLVVSRESGKR